MGNIHNGDKSIKKDILLVLITGLVGFFIGLFSDFAKTAFTDLNNYNAIRIKREDPVINKKTIELKFEIYKLGNKPSSFYFDFELSKEARGNDNKIADRPIPKEISGSVLEYGEITFIDYDIEDGNGSIYFKDVNKENKFEVIINVSASDKSQILNRYLNLNVKPEDPSEMALNASLWDFRFKHPYVTTIAIAFILLIVTTLISFYIIVTLIKKKKGELKDAEE